MLFFLWQISNAIKASLLVEAHVNPCKAVHGLVTMELCRYPAWPSFDKVNRFLIELRRYGSVYFKIRQYSLWGNPENHTNDTIDRAIDLPHGL
jgi:hypothetical protein